MKGEQICMSACAVGLKFNELIADDLGNKVCKDSAAFTALNLDVEKELAALDAKDWGPGSNPAGELCFVLIAGTGKGTPSEPSRFHPTKLLTYPTGSHKALRAELNSIFKKLGFRGG